MARLSKKPQVGNYRQTTLSFTKKGPARLTQSPCNPDDRKRTSEETFEQELADADFLNLYYSGTEAHGLEENSKEDLNGEDTPSIDSPEENIKPAFYPLQPLEEHTYICPFKTNGSCKKSMTFRNLQALAAHIDNKHNGLILIPFEESVVPDGTKKIPCRKGCDRMFATYSAETYHAKSCSRVIAGQYPRQCPWPGCVEPPLADAKAYATHQLASFHTTDSAGLYSCHRCSKNFCDIYMLGSHETRCKGLLGEGRANACKVYELSTSQTPPSILIIARSSGAAPASWYCGEEFLKDGLPLFGRAKYNSLLNDYPSLFGASAATRFYALYDVHTSYAPTGLESDAKSTDDPSIRSFFNRARQFTLVIDAALAEMSQQGNPVYLVSIGIDGFGCKASLMLSWLKRSPRFILVIRETELCWGMTEENFPRAASGLYWGFFDTRDIIEALETGKTTGEAVENLIAA
jgi:hypothetical protein